ncbi:MAG: adenosylcobinamide amidohydrolase [Candidatus Methanoplasma sp.]|jgi:adenosylcobinamide hydrolase|nr:adenosylcobinamide amidohydrolase [Candidatus Methanoplasma sp.]
MVIDWEDVIAAEKKEERRTIREFPCGVSVHRQNRSLIVTLPSKNWRALSTGNFNGGFMSSPSAVFNTTSLGGTAEYSMMGKPKEIHNRYSKECAKLVGLDPSSTVGLGTAAHMDNAAICSTESNGIEISMAITGGIMINGGRAGDPASYDEMERTYNKNGTIVIILIINADLSDSALMGAMMTATEAKSRTLLKLMGKSLYSNGIATGSGTDQVAVLCNKKSRNKVIEHSNGSELAKAIRGCVEKTLAKALDDQTMMNTETQCNPYVMISRHKISELNCHDEIRYPFKMKILQKALKQTSEDAKAAAAVSGALHIMDEMEWGLIPPDAGTLACREILRTSLRGPSMEDPVLKKRFDMTETPAETIRLAMAMILFDKAVEIGRKEAAEGSA